MRVTATYRWTFAAAHRLSNHGGKCQNLHGHNYVVELEVSRASGTIDYHTGSPSGGMVIDFTHLKRIQGTFDSELDHTVLVSDNDPELDAALHRMDTRHYHTDGQPTAEVLALTIASEARVALDPDGLAVMRVRVYENESCWAEVTCD